MEAHYLSPQDTRRPSPTSNNNFSNAASQVVNTIYTPDSELDRQSFDSAINNPHSNRIGSDSPITSVTASAHGQAGLRKRGRPRKHPLIEARKTTHARSRTGCATCRRRKKKCDERKPTCLACEKNNVFCDGYEPLVPWKSGKEKSTASPLVSPSSVPELPLLVDGIENNIDQLFLQHFLNVVCNTLFINDHRNFFQNIVVPMSMSNQGLMHGLLFLSSTCLLAHDTEQKSTAAWQVRQAHHSSMSMRLLHRDLSEAGTPDKPKVGDAVILHALILCLQTIGAGDTSGAWRIHSKGVLRILLDKSWTYRDQQVHRFVEEIFLHHESCAAIANLTSPFELDSIELCDTFASRHAPLGPTSSALIGIHDGLFKVLPKIRALRDRIRERKQLRLNPMDEQVFSTAFSIDSDLRATHCMYPADSLRYTAYLLYRQAIWLFLHRTIQPSRPSTTFQRAVDEGLKYIAILHESGESSMQSVMLMPLFLLGCAAFDSKQRPHITEALERLKSWAYMGNVRHVQTVIEHMWQLMDSGDREKSWSWEAIIAEQGWDFIVA